MIQMITAEQFWNEMDIAREKLTIAQLSESCGIPTSLMVSTRQRQGFLSFENTIRVCRTLSIDMNSFIDCDVRENDRLIHPIDADKLSVGAQFWMMLEEVLAYRGWSWRYIALKSNIATTTINSAKNSSRTLPFDTTLKLLKAMDLTPDAIAKNIYLTENSSSQLMEQKSSLDIKRDRLIRTIKRLDESDLDTVIEYVDFIRSRTK